MSSMKHSVISARHFFCSIIILSLMLASSIANAEPPVFSKAFLPSTIGPGSVSTLTFTINNSAGSMPAENLIFTDMLPTNVTLATPANASTDCANPTLTAVDGGSDIILNGGQVGANSSCTINVDVTSVVAGMHSNTSGPLSSSAGDSGTTSANLIVSASLPGFSKSFSPSSINIGGRSTLTFTMDSTTKASPVGSLDFTDNLPTGLVVASPSNASTDCISASLLDTTITAIPGSSVIMLDANGFNIAGFEVLPMMTICTVAVDVTATGGGTLINSTELLADSTTAGKATAAIDITADELSMVKSFINDPATPGTNVVLQFTITNRNRFNSATGIAFTDNLETTLTGLTATNVDTNTCGGSIDIVTNSSIIDFSGGSVASNGSTCNISITLAVPGGAVEGAYPNTTSTVSANIGGAGTYSAATDTLFVQAVPIITQSFTDDPVASGGSVTLQYTVTNPSPGFAATDITFDDELTTFLPFPVSVTLPPVPNPPCGGGSSLALASLGSDRQGLSLTGGSLIAGDTCSFSVTIDIPNGFPGGIYTNTTGTISATINGTTATGNSATDDLTVVGSPTLRKSFTNDPVAPGGAVTLEFTISHADTAPGNATNIAFSDDLNNTLTDLATSGVATNTCGGTFSAVASSGGENVSLSNGGPLAPGASCTITVPLLVPAAAIPGNYTNTTSGIVATTSGVSTTGNPGVDILSVTGLTLSKEFIDDPLLPGELGTLRFTLDNTSSAVGATGIAFTDDLDNTLPGLTSEGTLPTTDPACGVGSAIAGPTLLMFTNGDLAAGASCSFDIPIRVPGGAANGAYNNTTSSLTAMVSGTGVTLDPATDNLTVSSSLLSLSKSFTDDPVTPGSSVTLEFTLNNLDMTRLASSITFNDDLDAALTGLTATAVNTNTCGGTANISTPSIISYSGGSLAADTACTINVTLLVPASTPPGTAAVNTTSAVTGTIGGLTVTGDPAIDTLFVQMLTLDKAFDGSATPGGTVTLDFTVQNVSSTSISGFGFTDDLSAVLPGLVATGLPLNDVCGAGSQLAGTSVLTFIEGTLLPGATCTISVTLQIPSSATAGTYTNTTSNLLLEGLAIAGPATATLTIDPPPLPTFSKGFSPTSVNLNAPSTLTFTINNTSSFSAATALDFTDNLPAGLLVASPANASTSCTGGTLTAISGTGVVSYTGGMIASASSCTVVVNVSSNTAATYNNVSGNLTSSAGNSGTATASLVVSTITIFDDDGDGVLNTVDLCPATAIPETAPAISQYAGYYTLFNADRTFDTITDAWLPTPPATFILDDTAGCSCEQIIAAEGLGQHFTNYGCPLNVMNDWIANVP